MEYNIYPLIFAILGYLVLIALSIILYRIPKVPVWLKRTVLITTIVIIASPITVWIFIVIAFLLFA